MAEITFNDKLTLTGVADQTTLSGLIGVTYGTTNAVVGTINLSAANGLAAQTYTNLTITQTGTTPVTGIPIYTLRGVNADTSIAITYTGQTPTSVTAQVLNATAQTLAAGGGAVTSIVCFAAGTRLRTSRGEIAVEGLKKGDEVVTASGTRRKIVWVGSRKIDCRNHPEPRAVMPIRIAKDAFGTGKPVRDLSVSPGHGICVAVLDEVLIPATLLVNGTTVTQLDVAEITYWHVELESHDIVLAEGLPTESYIDVGNRTFFADGKALPDGRPDAATLDDYCRPYVTDEGLTRAVRARLQARARKLGWRLDDAPEMRLAIVADGKAIQPEMDGLVARFTLPASTTEAWLVSDTTVPAYIRDTWDGRRLGVCVGALAVGTGSTLREIAIDDPKLTVGFHYPEGAPGARFRWTTGRALLPAASWRGMAGTVRLEVRLAAAPLPRWTAPAQAGDRPPARPSLVSSAA